MPLQSNLQPLFAQMRKSDQYPLLPELNQQNRSLIVVQLTVLFILYNTLYIKKSAVMTEEASTQKMEKLALELNKTGLAYITNSNCF